MKRRAPSRAWEVRPLTGMIRGALINALAPRLPGARVLDLFAGTGSFGLDALSRGASKVTFVEADAGRCRALERLAGRGRGAMGVRCGDAWEAVEILREEGAAFDIIFCDPPFPAPFREDAWAAAGELLAPEGWAILRRRAKSGVPERAGRLGLARTRRYGDSLVAWYAVAP